MGWPVLPLRHRDKRPANSNGLTGASTDMTQINEWWTKWPSSNIGLRTGDAFDVLDVDGKAGILSLALTTLETDATTKYHHPGPIQSTGKGYHLLFIPTGARNFAGRHPGLDFRGQRGYIVASPSIHPNGHQYRWIRNGELPEPPAWLTNMLIPKHEPLRDRHNAHDIIRIVTQSLPIISLTPLGARFIAKCIWHDDSTPSLVFYPENNSFFCFGCEEWGDTTDIEHFIKGPNAGIRPSDVRLARTATGAQQ